MVWCMTVALGVYAAQSMINPWIDCEDDISCGAKKAENPIPKKTRLK